MTEMFFLNINFQNVPYRLKSKDKYKIQHACAYSLLIYIIKIRYGICLKKSNIRKTSFGKPYISCNNLNINFSIAHSDNIVVVAISDSKIGIDVEAVTPMKFDITNYDDFFTSKEIEAVVNSKNRERAFSILWTRKEASVKYLDVGLESFYKTTLIKNIFINSFFIKVISGEEYAVSIVCEKNELKRYKCSISFVEKYIDKFMAQLIDKFILERR